MEGIKKATNWFVVNMCNEKYRALTHSNDYTSVFVEVQNNVETSIKK